MKHLYLLLFLFAWHAGHAQVKDGNKTRQIEQLQELKKNVSHRIDTLHLKLAELADSLEAVQYRLERLKTAHIASSSDKNESSTRENTSRNSQTSTTLANMVTSLQKRFDQRLVELDKAVNLENDLDDKISILLRESNR